jgi:hypothetical protein
LFWFWLQAENIPVIHSAQRNISSASADIARIESDQGPAVEKRRFRPFEKLQTAIFWKIESSTWPVLPLRLARLAVQVAADACLGKEEFVADYAAVLAPGSGAASDRLVSQRFGAGATRRLTRRA